MKKEIDIDDAMPEMLLVEGVRTKVGAVLLPEGTELSEKIIGLLKSKGVANITVSTMHGPSASSCKTAEVERVNKLFTPHKEEPAMADLRDILIDYLGGDIGNGHEVKSKTA